MHFSTSITRIASTPPWANITKAPDGVEGFWVDLNVGDKVFLRKQDHVIWLPKSLRGRKVESLAPEELKALPKEDSGKAHYKSWREQNDAEQGLSKLYNGYQFTDAGKVMLERLSKLIDKYELDDVANIGLESKYSINPMLIEKLLQTNNRDDVSRIGRLIGKKFALLIHLLNQVNPKIAKRLDADFMFAYKKFIPLFGFNPVEYQPNIQQQPENEPIGLAHIYTFALQNAIKEIRPLLAQDLAFYPVMQGFTKLLAMVKQGFDVMHLDKVKDAYTDLMAQIVSLGQSGRSQDPFAADPAQISQQVVASPALQEFHSLLMSPQAQEQQPNEMVQ